MDSLRILNADEVRSLLTLSMALEADKAAYIQKQQGMAAAWPLLFHEFSPGMSDMDLKSGNLDGDDIWGLKVISCYKSNPEHGLAVYHSAALAFDHATGRPVAVLNAGPVTSFRTGAAAALGARLLARKDAVKLLVCGTGGVAPYAVAATLVAMPRLEEIVLVNPHHPQRAARRLDAIRSEVSQLLTETGASDVAARLPDILHASEDLEAAVRTADVIITATPSTKPFIRAEWVKPGTHLSCLGADKPGKQELDAKLLQNAHVFADDVVQARTVGECEMAYNEGLLATPPREIGAVLTGEAVARASDDEITVFDSTGLALQDLATFSRVIAAAEAIDRGTVIPF